MKHNSFVIAGPTASGKSDFAHKLATRVNGVVINADSVQIYAGIENISASPIPNSEIHEIEGVPYRLYSVLPLTKQISVADYLNMARKEYDAAIAAGKTPIFVGGSGYYIGVLLNGISQIPEISSENRERARQMVSDYPDAAKQLLKNADIDFAFTDPQRMSRALEVFLETGRPLSEWQKLPRVGAITPTPLKILINPHRDILAKRIVDRIPQMLSGGAMAEAHAILASGWDPSRAIGADELVKLLRNEISERAAIDNWITRTNQYAKRQRTWFRNQLGADIEISHVPTDKDLEIVLSK